MRLFTSFLVIILCGFTIFHGWRAVQFVETPAGSLSAGPWSRPPFPGLESLALQRWLAKAGNAHDPAAAERRRGALVRLLSRKPLSPQAWLQLAGLRLVTREPSKRVLEALEMSWITGPNEGAVMMERALFALLEWRALPADAQRRALQDLAGAIGAQDASDRQIFLAKTLLAAEPAASRERIARILRTDGVSPGEFRAIGFRAGGGKGAGDAG